MADCSFTDTVIVKDSPEARRMKWELDHFNPPVFKPRTGVKPVSIEQMERNTIEFCKKYLSKKSKDKHK